MNGTVAWGYEGCVLICAARLTVPLRVETHRGVILMGPWSFPYRRFTVQDYENPRTVMQLNIVASSSACISINQNLLMQYVVFCMFAYY